MENSVKQNVEETPKKAWITPEMQEINVNGGVVPNLNEKSTSLGNFGMDS